MKKSLFLLCMYTVFCQAQHSQHQGSMEGMNHKKHPFIRGFLGNYSIMRESNGTSWQPESSPMCMIMWQRDDWSYVAEGFFNPTYDHQGGPRGDTSVFASNMLMFMAHKTLPNKGLIGFHTMFSFEPLTIGKQGYPLLLQTGETADGKTPLIDRQHPHDFFTELALLASAPLSEKSSVYGYFALPGAPALGPPVYNHRYSGMYLPAAPITHHWLDSTHIAFGVITLGTIFDTIKLEGSIFTGREPDQHRWDIEKPRFDSQAIRFSWNPTPAWALQVSFGNLKAPEQLEPDVNVKRITASIMYNKKFETAVWQTTGAWGRNINKPGHTLDALLLESVFEWSATHMITGRYEWVKKDELFLPQCPLAHQIFPVSKLDLAYLYHVLHFEHARISLGSSISFSFVPKELKPFYGNSPFSYYFFMHAELC